MIENKRRIWIWAVLIGLLGTCIVSFIKIYRLEEEKQQVQRELDEEIQQGIADEIFRFHVLANSDTKSDQELKMKVKTGIVKYLEETLQTGKSREDTKKKYRCICRRLRNRRSRLSKKMVVIIRFWLRSGHHGFLKKRTETVRFRKGNMRRFELKSEKQKGITGGVSCIRDCVFWRIPML